MINIRKSRNHKKKDGKTGKTLTRNSERNGEVYGRRNRQAYNTILFSSIQCIPTIFG